MKYKVLLKLDYFGLDIEDGKLDSIIESTLDEVKQEILNECNLDEFPKELSNVLVIRTVGSLLSIPFIQKKINVDGLDLDRAVSSITRGDISMSFKEMSDGEKMQQYISKLEKYGQTQIYKFRRIVWE